MTTWTDEQSGWVWLTAEMPDEAAATRTMYPTRKEARESARAFEAIITVPLLRERWFPTRIAHVIKRQTLIVTTGR